MTALKLTVFFSGSSASGDTVFTISSSDPDIEKYINFDFTKALGAKQETPNFFREITRSPFDTSFTFASPGKAAAGSGRSFVSASNFDKFSLPFFFMPTSYESFGFGNLGSWLKNIEGHYDSSLLGNGEIKTVTAVNNGHVYGEVKTVTFDNQKDEAKNVS